MKPSLRVLLIDDHEEFLRSAARVIAERPGLEVIAAAASALHGLELVDTLAPDVVVMEAFMRGLDGLTATRLIKALARPPRVVLMLPEDCMQDRERCLRVGADACVAKRHFAETIFDAVQPAAAREAAI